MCWFSEHFDEIFGLRLFRIRVFLSGLKWGVQISFLIEQKKKKKFLLGSHYGDNVNAVA